jgi:hypothetical protein
LYYARAKGGVDGIEHDEAKEDNIDEQGLELQGDGRDSNNAIYKMAGGNLKPVVKYANRTSLHASGCYRSHISGEAH